MSADGKIGKLRALLDRVRTRAAAPRAAAAPALAPVPAHAAPPPRASVSELEIFEEEELSDINLIATSAAQPSQARVEVSEVTPGVRLPPAAAAPEAIVAGAELDVSELEEEVPASAPRSLVIAAAIGEALSSAPDRYDLEEPLKTPPPESGRQELAAPPAGAIETQEFEIDDEDMEAELSSEEFAPLPSQPGPTIEQLGQVVDLEPLVGSTPLDLDSSAAQAPSSKSARSLTPAPAAARPSSVAPARRPTPAPPTPGGASPAAHPPVTTLPQTYERPAPPAGNPVTFSAAPTPREPETFLELLDASLSL